MKGLRKTIVVSTVLLGMFVTGLAVQTAQAGGGRFFLSFCELCQEENLGRQVKGSTYPWPRYSYHQYRGKHCDARLNTGLYQRYEYDRYQVKSTQPIHGEMLPLPLPE
ncbi:hypothetical protein [Gimesia maris]|uniref:Uncharacterized protein n=1 Tax=Gimesia maris TaxID=122 RepID=A0ABX5YTF7_9PLAN|nr:hypothetical protein [Gimesia maris]EDL56489.1 seryl-tRNA synthetase [Gimesia maris DSM 8797]QDU16872.1 hypothetical protein CA11_47080 [Gimesia maris]QEG18918.1 hypothetical protein GmarT_48120 [Gimesia maris]QGQ28177.1 hypothetical protein F1729_05635 [Gimesia maris]